MISISVIIPTWNEEDCIADLLTALQMQDHTGPMEVLVVDGGSQDATADIVRRFPDVRLLIADRPGVSIQRNRGAAAAQNELLVFLDADNRPGPTFLSRLAGEYARRPFAVACPWFRPDSRHIGIHAFYFVFNCLFWLSQWRFHTGAGICIATQRAVFLQAGGFNETLHLGEDVDYIRRSSHQGRHAHLPIPLITSARRFETDGVGRMIVFYLRISPYLLRGSFDALRSVSYKPVAGRNTGSNTAVPAPDKKRELNHPERS